MPLMRPIRSMPPASSAPVEPAETTASASPARTAMTALTIEDSVIFRTASIGASCMPITSGAWTTSMPSSPSTSGFSTSSGP